MRVAEVAAVLLVLTLLAWGTPSAGAVQDKAAFLLAVLNRDSLAVPFAAFNGRRWVTPWPDDRATTLPINLDSVDSDWWGIGARPERMLLWFNGEQRGPVALQSLALVRSLCASRVGLRTDYKPKQLAPPRLRQPYPKDGLLISADVPVGRIDTLERGSPEWIRAAAAVASEFEKMENRAISSFEGWRHPLDEARRRRHPLTLEAVYRAASDKPGWTTYFVEAVKDYPARLGDRGCGVSTTGQGWLHVGPNGKTHVELTSRVTYCDRKGVGFMLPLGTVRAAGRTYWVYQFSGYEAEFYQVVRPEPDDVRVAAAYYAGSCPG